jgi:hypothetical protein
MRHRRADLSSSRRIHRHRRPTAAIQVIRATPQLPSNSSRTPKDDA